MLPLCFWPALSANWSWKTILVFLRVAVLDRFNSKSQGCLIVQPQKCSASNPNVGAVLYPWARFYTPIAVLFTIKDWWRKWNEYTWTFILNIQTWSNSLTLCLLYHSITTYRLHTYIICSNLVSVRKGVMIFHHIYLNNSDTWTSGVWIIEVNMMENHPHAKRTLHI